MITMTPETGNGWFPRLRGDGKIICGVSEVFYGLPNDWKDMGPGGRPVWLDWDRILIGTQDGKTILIDTVNGSIDLLPGYNKIVAGAGRWFGYRPGYGVDEYLGKAKVSGPVQNRVYHSMSPDGTRVAYVDNPQQNIKSLYLNGNKIETADIHSASVSDLSLCWLVATSMYGREVHGLRNGVVEKWNVLDPEYDPQVIDAPDGPWVASGTQEPSLLLRPAGSKVGYRLRGDHYNAHVRWIDNAQKFCVVSSTDAGVIQVEWVNPISARVDLTVVPFDFPDTSKKLLVGAWRTTAATPGNLALDDDPSGVKAIVCDIEELSQVDQSRLIGLFVAEEQNPAFISLQQRIAQCRPVAERLRVPMFVYHDGRDYPYAEVVQWCGTTPFVIMPQWYLKVGESPDVFAADVVGQAAQFIADRRRFLPALRCHTSKNVKMEDTIAPDQVIAALSAVADFIDGVSLCIGYALFAWNRKDGVTGVPALEPMATAWLSGKPTLDPAKGRAWAAAMFSPVPSTGLAIAVTNYGPREGVAPLVVFADYEVTGGSVIESVSLLLNGVPMAQSQARSGRLSVTVDAPADYVLVAAVKADGKTAVTGAVRTVRVLPPIVVPPVLLPALDGKAGYTQASEEAAAQLKKGN